MNLIINEQINIMILQIKEGNNYIAFSDFDNKKIDISIRDKDGEQPSHFLIGKENVKIISEFLVAILKGDK